MSLHLPISCQSSNLSLGSCQNFSYTIPLSRRIVDSTAARRARRQAWDKKCTKHGPITGIEAMNSQRFTPTGNPRVGSVPPKRILAGVLDHAKLNYFTSECVLVHTLRVELPRDLYGAYMVYCSGRLRLNLPVRLVRTRLAFLSLLCGGRVLRPRHSSRAAAGTLPGGTLHA